MPPTTRQTLVFGPAYLDRVLRVDRPLLENRTLDQSIEGHPNDLGSKEEILNLTDTTGGTIRVEPLPSGWPGPTGTVRLSGVLNEGQGGWSRCVGGVSWHDDLGGMGAGYARALAGILVSALGPDDDPHSRSISALLALEGIRHRPIHIADRPADWTLLVTSGGHGDKLAIGLRGCHAALRSLADRVEPCDLLVVAGLPNALAAPLLSRAGEAVRFLAPAWRNVTDRDCPLSSLADRVDILCCNRREWEALDNPDTWSGGIALVAVTDGPRGSRLRFQNAGGRPSEVTIPAFPRDHPPRDTNRAGEAYAATLVSMLLDAGWRPGPLDEGLARRAGERASAAAALVIDRSAFSFPTSAEIDEALRAGRVIGRRSEG